MQQLHARRRQNGRALHRASRAGVPIYARRCHRERLCVRAWQGEEGHLTVETSGRPGRASGRGIVCDAPWLVVTDLLNSSAAHLLARSRAAGTIDRDEEVALVLAARGQAGDPAALVPRARPAAGGNAGQRAALERLVTLNLRHVVAVALLHRKYGVMIDDLVSEGCVGLVHAIGKFDPSRGTRLVTYAGPWIRAMILQHVRKTWSLVSTEVGGLKSRNFFRLRREHATIAARCSDPAEIDRLLDERLGPGAADAMRHLEARDVSIDAPGVEGSRGRTLADQLPGRDESPEEHLDRERARRRAAGEVRRALCHLDPREHRIVLARLMGEPEDVPSLADLAREMGVSRERTRQLEMRAIAKLKKLLRGGQLVPPEAR